MSKNGYNYICFEISNRNWKFWVVAFKGKLSKISISLIKQLFFTFFFQELRNKIIRISIFFEIKLKIVRTKNIFKFKVTIHNKIFSYYIFGFEIELYNNLHTLNEIV